MNISIVTLFPDLYEPFIKTSLVNKAIEQGHINILLNNIFNYSKPKERIDSPTFGHGAGMLIKPDIIQKAIESQEASLGPAYKIFFSPQGKKLDQILLKSLAAELQEKKHIMLLPARYEGMDARVEEHYADCVISIGDFVLMGGDLPAMVLIEGLLRLIPGVIGKKDSVEQDSFYGPFVDYPEFTEPVVWKDYEVPAVIRSGNHQKISEWREEIAIKKTILCHFEWLKTHIKNEKDIEKVCDLIPAHYAVLMHDQVIMEAGREGTSSVTSLDIHDIARSARTFGLKKYFIVTPLADQQRIIRKLLDFWQTEEGFSYNKCRHEALNNVILVNSLDEVLVEIEKIENKKPVLIATAARKDQTNTRIISYFDQAKVWSNQRPVAFIFGTARGLSKELINKCDYLLAPIAGFSSFNHLSVRSAAAIVFDRWLGINTVPELI